MIRSTKTLGICGCVALAGICVLGTRAAEKVVVLQGQAAFTDYAHEAPGTFRKITPADLPAPFATKSADNGPDVIPRPEGAWPKALPGFKVTQYATGLDNPRLILRAPNGDIFLAESGPGRLKVLRG
ncbi:MAG TPA: hypothetical protein VLT57_13465, partial [Bryobacteraceae bacterium]|nr:hypothetical protein [Bryobacteraceae bacterium]